MEGKTKHALITCDFPLLALVTGTCSEIWLVDLTMCEEYWNQSYNAYVLSLVVFPVVLTAADVIELRACVLALGEPLHELPDDVLGLGPEVVGGRAEDKLGSLCRLDDGELFVLAPRLLAGAVFCVVLLEAPVQHKNQPSSRARTSTINLKQSL